MATRPAARGPVAQVLARPGPRRLALACAALAGLTAVLLVVQWALVAAVVSAVFAGRAAPGDLLGALAGALAAWLARAGLLALRELLAARASARTRHEVRSELVGKVLRLGPALMAGERAGELVTTATEGVAKLDGLVARLLPGAVWAAVLPPLLAGTVLVLDPPSGALLLATGPLLVFFLWLVGT
ncbi:MAG TPA: ABC transporter transmembrane domain-containing protein, partial [Candidatus Limnocylindria bacterium]|nr:ABC transporter transmembrane domain-containing protein [Candidatus Limnocylindria bacterium]